MLYKAISTSVPLEYSATLFVYVSERLFRHFLRILIELTNLSIGWCLLAVPLFSMPTSATVTKDTMNYASVVFVGFVSVSGIWYLVWGQKNYIGPVLDTPEDPADSLYETQMTEEVSPDINYSQGKAKPVDS